MPAASGKATFGFVAKYQKGATIPTGNTEFQFQAGGFRFSSSSYQWLVVAGSRVQYKGDGTVDGTGGYGFMLTAIDGETNSGGDRLRLKVWDLTTGAVAYDNRRGVSDDFSAADPQMIGGGNITVHHVRTCIMSLQGTRRNSQTTIGTDVL